MEELTREERIQQEIETLDEETKQTIRDMVSAYMALDEPVFQIGAIVRVDRFPEYTYEVIRIKPSFDSHYYDRKWWHAAEWEYTLKNTNGLGYLVRSRYAMRPVKDKALD